MTAIFKMGWDWVKGLIDGKDGAKTMSPKQASSKYLAGV
jgi:hypothetical protein